MDLELTRVFKKRFRKKPADQRQRVLRTMKLLSMEVRYPGLHTHKVEGTQRVFEAYVDDAVRVTFEYASGGIRLRNNCPHDAVLRSP